MKWPSDYLNERAQEERIKRNKRMLWLGKFAFPKVNTKRTSLMFVPEGYREMRFPIIEPLGFKLHSIEEAAKSAIRYETVELQKFGYNGKRWTAIIKIGYSESADRLIVKESSFAYQRKSELTEHKF